MAENQTPSGVYVLLAAAAALIVGPFLPWLQATAPLVGTISKNGVDNGSDGLVLLGVGIVLGLVALTARESPWLTRLAFLGAIGGGLLLAYDTSDIQNRFQSVHDGSGLISTSYGAGLYLSWIGVVLSLVGAFMVQSARAQQRRQQLPFDLPG